MRKGKFRTSLWDWILSRSSNWSMTRSIIRSKEVKKALTSWLASIASLGRLIEVKERFPRPQVWAREGSWTFDITRVRQPM